MARRVGSELFEGFTELDVHSHVWRFYWVGWNSWGLAGHFSFSAWPLTQLAWASLQNGRLSVEFFFLSFCLFWGRAAPAAYGGSQARGLIRAIGTGLHQSHSNEGSELSLRPTPQLTATPDP